MVEDRLDLVKRLKAKYGGSVEAVMETALRARQELQALEHHGAHVRRDQAPRGCRTCRDRPERAIDEKAPGSCEAATLVTRNWRLSGWNRPPSRSSSPRKRLWLGFGPTGRDRVEFCWPVTSESRFGR